MSPRWRAGVLAAVVVVSLKGTAIAQVTNGASGQQLAATVRGGASSQNRLGEGGQPRLARRP
jgi:hypothetical protein